MALLTAVENSMVVAQLTANSGVDAAAIALGIIGTFTIVVMGLRALAAYSDEKYGKLITLILAAIPVIGIAYFPDTTLEILKGLVTSFIG